MIKFSDGVTFNTSGKCRIENRHDGLYVVGNGILCSVDSYEEGQSLIKAFNKGKEE
jgi:hypothetical protein